MKQTVKRLLCLLCTVMAMSVSAFAQITTSSLGGRIIDANGEPVPGAAVVAVHEPSGTVYGVVTNEDGRYTINGMRSGGPYKVEVSCLGYQTVINTDITLQLGEPYALNSSLNEDKEMLSEAVVIGQAASRFAGEKTGAATNISSSQMEALPTVSRSITDITKLSPYGGDGTNFSGMDGRSTNFTVDGANFNNNFGLNSGLPAGGSPISIDAIDEIQVVVSPYDVRQTNFIGGGINAITKSGTNQFKGSAYVYHNNENMRGNMAAGVEVAGARDKDRTTTYGVTFGGPIIKNKLFFFANFERTTSPSVVNRWRASKDGVADPDRYISRVTETEMKQVKDYLWNEYGYDTGSYTDYPAESTNTKLLARIDWNITDKHHLAVRYNYTLDQSWTPTNANSSDCGTRHPYSAPRLSEYGMAFANSIYSTDKKVNSFSIDLNSNFTNNLSNQLLVTYSKMRDGRGSPSEKFPFIDILEGYTVNDEGVINQTIMPYISAGYELFTWNNGVNNNVLTVKDDLVYFKGNHKITAGLSYEHQMADNSYVREGTGYYRYRSLDDFLSGTAVPETVTLTYGYGGETNPSARVRFSQYGLYGQDEWDVTDRFKLTYGIRFDTIVYNNADLMTNNAIKALDYGGFHVDTGYWPTPKVQVSPRVGFTWDILGDRSLKLRGGTGLFAGRLPLVFFTNMPTNSGMIQNLQTLTTKYDEEGNVVSVDPLLQHFGDKMVTNTDELLAKLNKLDPKRFPLDITPEDGVLPSKSSYVDSKFKMPQIWKTSIALDYQLPVNFPFTVSGEFIFNKTVNGVMVTDLNIKDNSGWPRFSGADNRHIYPSDYMYESLSTYMLTNTNRGYGWTGNVTLNMRPIEGLDIMAAYTHTVSKEVSGMPGSDPASVFQALPTVDGPNFSTLQNSSYVIPDRVIASLTYNDKSGNLFSFFYSGMRGSGNASYMYQGDINGDGIANDLIYIPKDESEIKFVSEKDSQLFWDYVAQDKYLSSHKGQYAEAYSVYSPWSHRIDFRYAHNFKVKTGNSTNTLQLNFDFKNIANLFNSNWGVTHYISPESKSGRILALDHIDEAGYPVYKANVTEGAKTWAKSTGIGQCWYLQVGIKYMFN